MQGIVLNSQYQGWIECRTDNECYRFGHFLLFEFEQGFCFDIAYSILTFSKAGTDVEEGGEGRGTDELSLLIGYFVLSIIATGFCLGGIVAIGIVVRESAHVICNLESEENDRCMRTGKYLLFGMAIHL